MYFWKKPDFTADFWFLNLRCAPGPPVHYQTRQSVVLGKLVNLSVQQLVDCVPVCTCAYGSSIVSTKYVAEYGLTSEVQYPYQGWQSELLQ